MCLRFADMECKLGEIDRARAIYSYCSQICDPRVSDLSLILGIIRCLTRQILFPTRKEGGLSFCIGRLRYA